jgi:tetratricopeptide (TPR) repeat protein
VNLVPSASGRSIARLALLSAALLSVLAMAGPARAQQSEADVFVAEAILAYEDKRFDAALALLQQALQIDGENVDALYYAGVVQIARRRLDLAVEPLEKARGLAPADLSTAFQLGVVYFSQERFDRAEPPLTQVFDAEPRTDSVGYYVGFMRYRRKDYQGAVRAFNAGTSSDPNIQQLSRFYAGLAYAILGLPERAAAEVDAALRAQPTSALTGPAERLRDTILAARERERRFRAEVRLGVLYDTNVRVVPEPSHDPTAEAARRRDKQSPGELMAVRAEYSWLRRGPWESTLTYSFFQTINNDLPEFNVQNHLGALTGTYRASLFELPLQVGSQYAFDQLTLDGDKFVQRHTAAAFATLVEGATHLTSLQARYQDKSFFQEKTTLPEEIRDAKNAMVGFVHLLRFEQDRHLVRFGYQFDDEDAEGRNFQYVGHRYLVGAQYTLPRVNTRLKYDYDVHLRQYDNRHTLLPAVNPYSKERRDTEQTHIVRVEQPLPWDLTLAVESQSSIARSNLPVFSFNRNVFSLSLSWQY